MMKRGRKPKTLAQKEAELDVSTPVVELDSAGIPVSTEYPIHPSHRHSVVAHKLGWRDRAIAAQIASGRYTEADIKRLWGLTSFQYRSLVSNPDFQPVVAYYGQGLEDIRRSIELQHMELAAIGSQVMERELTRSETDPQYNPDRSLAAAHKAADIALQYRPKQMEVKGSFLTAHAELIKGNKELLAEVTFED